MIHDRMPFYVGALTEANRPIRLRLGTPHGVVDDLLLVKHVRGTEVICGGIEYSLLCVSMRAGMELKQFIANPVELQFVTASGNLRTVSGIVSSAREGQSDGGLATYQLIVRDAFSLLEATSIHEYFAMQVKSILPTSFSANGARLIRSPHERFASNCGI